VHKFFLLLDPRTTPSGRKVIRRREKKERRGGEKNNEFSGHFVCHSAHLQRRTGSARTSLGPIPLPNTEKRENYYYIFFPWKDKWECIERFIRSEVKLMIITNQNNKDVLYNPIGYDRNGFIRNGNRIFQTTIPVLSTGTGIFFNHSGSG
jgi:hypothetical protein